jgi:hypothetical protein
MVRAQPRFETIPNVEQQHAGLSPCVKAQQTDNVSFGTSRGNSGEVQTYSEQNSDTDQFF